VGTALTYRFGVRTPSGQRLDMVGMLGASLGRGYVEGLANRVLSVVSVITVVVACLVAATVAFARRRPGVAVGAVCLVAGANLTTQALKASVFHRPDLQVSDTLVNSLPSGHTTVAASVACALMLAVGPRVRPWIGVFGAVYTAATGLSTVVMAWHRPSDVIAAVLVTGLWTGLVVLCGAIYRTISAPDLRPAAVPRRQASASSVVAVTLVVLGLVGAVAAAACALALRGDLAGYGVIRFASQLPHSILVTACGMSVFSIGGVSALTAGMCLVLVPPATPRTR
jgi:hypothetical protein